MLVMCIHLPSKTIFAVPGPTARQDIQWEILGSTEDGNSDYIVQPEELASFLESLYATVSAGTSDVHGLQNPNMTSHLYAWLHTKRQTSREKRTRERRKSLPMLGALLPGLTFAPPRVQHTPVDIFLNGKRIQDKLASAMTRKGATGWTCTMFRDTRSRGILPYCDTDFDFLWIHIDNNILSHSCLCPGAPWHPIIFLREGRTGIVVYPFGCAKDADLWTDAFKLSYSDPGIEDKIRSILTQSEDSDGSEVPDTTTCDQSRETHTLKKSPRQNCMGH